MSESPRPFEVTMQIKDKLSRDENKTMGLLLVSKVSYTYIYIYLMRMYYIEVFV